MVKLAQGQSLILGLYCLGKAELTAVRISHPKTEGCTLAVLLYCCSAVLMYSVECTCTCTCTSALHCTSAVQWTSALQCTMYICSTLYIVHLLYSAQCTHAVQCTVYTCCAVYSVHTLYSAHCTPAVQCTVSDYRGVRISSTGKRFLVERATVWNIKEPDGTPLGQAATFSDWTFL